MIYHLTVERLKNAVVIVLATAALAVSYPVTAYFRFRRRQIIKYDFNGDEDAYEKAKWRGDL